MSNNYVHNPLEGNKPELVLELDKTVGELVSIIIVHKDRPAYLNLCLQSIDICSQNASYEIIVVDNGSGEETQEFLNEIQKDIKVVRNNSNVFWSNAASHGARVADPRSKYFIFMHCDVVITNNSWIDLLVNIAQANGSGMIGVETANYVIGSQKVDFISEWLVMISRSAYQKIGPWPDELPLVGHSFIMTIKAQLAGLRPQIMKNTIAHHYKMFSVNANDYERMTELASSIIPKIYKQVQASDV